jgi:hypothetical protein
LGYLNTTLGRLAEGVPETVGGETFHGERPTGPKTKQLHKLKSGGKLTADDLEKALAQ